VTTARYTCRSAMAERSCVAGGTRGNLLLLARGPVQTWSKRPCAVVTYWLFDLNSEGGFNMPRRGCGRYSSSHKNPSYQAKWKTGSDYKRRDQKENPRLRLAGLTRVSAEIVNQPSSFVSPSEDTEVSK